MAGASHEPPPGMLGRGLPPAETDRKEFLQFGNLSGVREEMRKVWILVWVEQLLKESRFLKDIRYAVRILSKSPGFTIIAVLTLALGIGVNTAIFSLVDCLALRPLPVERPGDVVFLTSGQEGHGATNLFSYPDFIDIQKQTSVAFADVSAFGMFGMDGLTVDGKSQSMWSAYVSGNFFRLLAFRPALGRLILPSEDSSAGANPVLVLSYAYWKSRFNSNPGVVGKKASVNGHPVTIVGVAPEGFHGLTALMDFQGYIPIGMATAVNDVPKDFFIARSDARIALIARLRSGVTLQQAQAVLNVVAQRLFQQYAAKDRKMSLHAFHLGPADFAFDPTNPNILPMVSALFLILSGSVLVVACVNIANLFLVRAAARQREMAVRAALGATRVLLVRQVLTESVLLALLGCVAGLAFGLGGSRGFSSIPLHTSFPIILDFHFDWRVFAYALAAAILTGVLVGIIPALRAARGGVNEILREGGYTSTTRAHRLRSTLVITQVSSSLMLLIVAGLFVRSLKNAQRTDLGFDPNNVLNLSIDTHEAGYNEEQAREFFRTLLDRARWLPGVQSASLASSVPLGYGGSEFSTLEIDGYQPAKDEGHPSAGYNAVSPGYFETMHMALIRGREIRDSDNQNSQRVAIINQTMANRYWNGQDPIDHYFTTTDDPRHPIAVIGVVRNAVENQILSPDQAFFYVPLSQRYSPVVTLQVRSIGVEALSSQTIGLIHSLESGMPVFDVQPMTAALNTLSGFMIFQFAAALTASLGILGLILAIIGVYGVISYAANQRRHEIGIRMALGAQPMQILKIISRQGLTIVGIGVIVGVLAAAAMARLLASFLFGVQPGDALTYGTAIALLAVAALLACYLPARRAMRVHPMVALRHE